MRSTTAAVPAVHAAYPVMATGHTLVVQNTIMYLVHHAHGLGRDTIHRQMTTADMNVQTNRLIQVIPVHLHLIRARGLAMNIITKVVHRALMLTQAITVPMAITMNTLVATNRLIQHMLVGAVIQLIAGGIVTPVITGMGRLVRIRVMGIIRHCQTVVMNVQPKLVHLIHIPMVHVPVRPTVIVRAQQVMLVIHTV